MILILPLLSVKILSLVVERYRSDERLDSILEVKAQPRKVISKSTRACSAALYERFIDSLEEVLQTFPDDVVGESIFYGFFSIKHILESKFQR